MADVVDILIDQDTYEIRIENGDFVLGESDPQHIELIFVIDKGQNRQYPLLGLGILKQLSGNIDPLALKQAIQKNLVDDGYRVNKIIVTPEYEITVDATRINTV